MAYSSLQSCISDLEKNNHLIRITEEVDPYLEMAAIHLRVFENNGPAILFENIKNCNYSAVSNLFGSLERSRFIFRDTIDDVKRLVELKGNPISVLKQPFDILPTLFTGLKALPKKVAFPTKFREIAVSELPLIQCWKKDGGAFVTLPQVYTEDINNPGVMQSNLGMYRIQLTGNDYELNKEIGLHYQLHRGIGVHQTIANKKGEPLKVCVFVGGPPSHSFAAVMPLPEGISELTFAGALGGRRFRYAHKEGFTISADADFVLSGYVYPNDNKLEGPFGDHLGYYSLTHDFPLMKVHKVWAKKDAIWPFTVVGRPPQEDTQFGALIHEITGSIIPKEIPGLHEVNAVDAAGVHPLLLAIGSERYTPYQETKVPQETLTIANHILGFGQMSLAKYLFITAKEDNPAIKAADVQNYFMHLLERVDWTRDLHFYTNTTIDTLDYSGEDLNVGSKVVIAAVGNKKRTLNSAPFPDIKFPAGFTNPKLVFPGVISLQAPKFKDTSSRKEEIETLKKYLAIHPILLEGYPLIILNDDSSFTAATINNFLWVTFTRSNPSHDIYGVDSFIENKHWGCNSSLIIDATIKSHHAPVLEKDVEIEKKVDQLGAKGNSLYGII